MHSYTFRVGEHTYDVEYEPTNSRDEGVTVAISHVVRRLTDGIGIFDRRATLSVDEFLESEDGGLGLENPSNDERFAELERMVVVHEEERQLDEVAEDRVVFRRSYYGED